MAILVYGFVFVCVYMTSLGPVVWTYAAETQHNTGLGVTVALFMLLTLIITVFRESLIHIPFLHFILSSISVLALLLVNYCVPETWDISEREKKVLFEPGSKYGRNLGKDEEITFNQ